MKTLVISQVNWYGRETFKPECEVSIMFCRLLKQKTLTREDLNLIKELGFEIKTKEISL